MFDKLKGLIFEEEKKEPVAASPAVQAPAAFMATASIGSGAVNNEMLGILTAALAANKTIHTTFKETADKIASVIADEATRFKTAAATIGASKEELLTALDGYAIVLTQEKVNFQANLDSTLGVSINLAQKLLEDTNATIAGLNAQLSTATEEKLRTEQLIGESQTQYASFVKDFEVTLAKVTSDLDVEHKKLEIYLGGQ